MKKILLGIFSLAFFLFIIGCSQNTDPQFRIKNEQQSKVNVNIQTSAGNKFSINDIEPGKTTEYQTAFVGNITATAVLQNESVSFLAEKSTRYTIYISTGKTPFVHIDK